MTTTPVVGARVTGARVDGDGDGDGELGFKVSGVCFERFDLLLLGDKFGRVG